MICMRETIGRREGKVAAVWVLVPACLFVFAAGCSGSGGGESPPLLGPDHMGFKNPICTQCHVLPVSGHAANLPTQCARCHGANGACDPNGLNSPREHDSGGQCLACHGNQHGFTNRNDCASCHFAASGLDESCGSPLPEDGTDGGLEGDAGDAGMGSDAGDDGGHQDGSADAGDSGGPHLSNALVDNCFNWPAEEFGPDNHAGLTTALSVGQPAVEFSLKDVGGAPHKLSELLAGKPVLLVFGAFT